MPSDKHDHDDGELGEELDLEQLEQEATKVKREALDLGFDEILPDESRRGGAASPHGASSLEMGSFVSKKEREAMERARGGTPTLDRLGKSAPKRARSESDGPVLPMDQELVISSKGLPGWGWALIAISLIAVLIGGGSFYMYTRHQAQAEQEAAMLEEARERQRAIEAERRRRLQED